MCLFIVCETTFTIGASRAISHPSYTEQQTQQVAIEILAGENLPPKVLWRFIGMRIEEDNREHRLAQRRQRRQHSDHKHVQNQRQKLQLHEKWSR